jgi:hypothetical protein
MKKQHIFKQQNPVNANRNHRYFPLFSFILLILFSYGGKVLGQTTVFLDKFNRASVSPGGTPSMSWTVGYQANSQGQIQLKGVDPELSLQISSNITQAVVGREYLTGPLSTFTAPFASTLKTNNTDVIWTFNMGSSRGMSSFETAFDAGTWWGSAVILAMTGTNPTNTATDGYAVVMTKGTTNNAFSLVKFNNGLIASANVTTIIGPSNDLSANTNWASIKVMYTPSSGTWKLFVRDDGIAASSNTAPSPAAGKLKQVGLGTVDNTYTSAVMYRCGFYLNHSDNVASTNWTRYDNFKVVLDDPYAHIDMTGSEDNIVLTDYQFRHPMTILSVEELAVIKNRIANGVEPQATAFLELIAAANAKQTFVPDPPTTMNIMSGYDTNSNLSVMRAWLWRNCSSAYTSALAYVYTGETKYADKAVEILNAWATKGTVFTGADAPLQLGSYFSPMLYAADLLHDYPGWSTTSRSKFKTWWTNNCLVHTKIAMYDYLNNWKDAGILGVMSAAIAFEYEDLLQSALVQLQLYFKVNPKASDPLNPSWKMSKDSRGHYLTDEVDRNLGRSGLTYTYYSLTTGIQCFEIARYAGYNFWTAQTSKGATYQGVIKQLFNWSILGETFPWYANPDNNITYQRNSYEIANNNCTLSTTMKNWLSNNRPVQGNQGDEYVTLNKGDLVSSIFKAPAAPTALVVSDIKTNPLAYISNGKLVLFGGEIYNSVGVKVASVKFNSEQTAIALRKGVYIVKSEGKSQKVLIQ